MRAARRAPRLGRRALALTTLTTVLSARRPVPIRPSLVIGRSSGPVVTLDASRRTAFTGQARRLAPQNGRPVQSAGAGIDAPDPRAAACRRSSKNWRAILRGGGLTSASANPRRCCANLTSGPGGGCAPSPGNNKKRGRTRFAELTSRGVGRVLAAQTAGSPHGPWRISQSPALTLAFTNLSFAAHGLPSLAPAKPHNPPNRRVRTRMPGGVGGTAP
jgi:hypothetical protein